MAVLVLCPDWEAHKPPEGRPVDTLDCDRREAAVAS